LGRESTMPELFVLGTGQDDNVGDVVLRREYFDRLRSVGHLHIFMGLASADFLDGLRLRDSDTVYTSYRQWHAAAWRALFRGTVWYVDKPGQLQLDRQTFRHQLKLLPLIVGIRLRKGQVLRLGLAMRALEPKYLRYLRPLFRLSTLIRWRDTSTSSAFNFGATGPDWAFGWDKTKQDTLDAERADIVVTYRGDRDPPSERILDLISAMARDGSRRVLVVSQVRRDAERSSYLAHRLNAELVPWPAERSLADHEEALRDVYRKSVLVISDRLHALIVGMTEGAVPLCITDRGEPKVERHLDAAGFNGSTVCVKDTSRPLAEVVEQHIGRRAEAVAATRAALGCLDDLTAQLAILASAGRPGGHVL
jgi:Polysaccharide pyruvyl transferase